MVRDSPSWHLYLKALIIKLVEFAHSLDQDEVAHNGLPLLNEFSHDIAWANT